MTRSKCARLCLILLMFSSQACRMNGGTGHEGGFDAFKKVVTINNWVFTLDVENQNKKLNMPAGNLKPYYLKATLYLANAGTGRSMLYSISKTTEDYEGMYKYLSFSAKNDLYIKNGQQFIYPIGYVFEPSNGLSNSDRLVYKFQLDDQLYKSLSAEKNVEYWYTDRLIGLGKICFTQKTQSL